MKYAALFIFGLLLASCTGLGEDEEGKLNDYKLNSKNYYTQGKYLQAIDQCRKGLAIDEDDYSLNLELGMALYYHSAQLKDRTERMRYLFGALEQLEATDSLRWFFGEDDYRVHLSLGMVHYRIATEYRRQLVDLERRLANVRSAPAASEEESDEIEESIESIEDSIAECDDGVDDEIDLAEDHFLKVLSYERQRENIDAILYLGQIYTYVANFPEAVEYLSLGLDLLERSTGFISRRLESEDTMDASERLFFETRLEENMNKEKDLRGILANALGRLERHEERLEQFQLLHERGMLDGALSYNKALAERDLGRYPEAIIDFNRFIREGLAPDSEVEDHDRLTKAINSMMEMAKEMEQANTVMLFVAANPEKEKDLRCALADLFASVGMFAKCVEQYDILQARDLMDGDLYFNRALAEQELGRYEEAILDYDLFLKEGGLSGLPLGKDERFRKAAVGIETCQGLLENRGRSSKENRRP